jgi:hypothetical protein
MTRRRKTSPPLIEKSASFGIPTSLHQFSAVSRLLANTMGTSKTAGTHTTTAQTRPYTPSQPISSRPPPTANVARPGSQSSTHSTSTLSSTPRLTQYVTPTSLPQKRSYSEQQTASQSSKRSLPSPPSSNGDKTTSMADAMAKVRAAAIAQRARQPPTAQHTVSAPKAVEMPTAQPKEKPKLVLQQPMHPNAVAALVAKQREIQAKAMKAQRQQTPAPTPHVTREPALQPGEAPSMATHPHLIAQMVAAKRAENERSGHRARWARKQAEYRASHSPGSQLSNELQNEASQSQAGVSPQRTVSEPVPARSTPIMQPIKPPVPLVFNVHTSTTQKSISDGMTSPQVKVSANASVLNNKKRQSTEAESLSGTPFSSPIVDFLEKATDGAGVRGPSDAADSRRPSAMAVPTSLSAPAPRIVSLSSSQGSDASVVEIDIPPLFTDKRDNEPKEQPKSAIPRLSDQVPPPKPSPPPQPPDPNKWKGFGILQQAKPAQIAEAQFQVNPQPPQLAPYRPPPPPSMPYYPSQAGMPGYYRVDMNQQWQPNGNNFTAMPATTAPPPYTYPPSHSNASYSGYTYPYAVAHGVPPAPNALRTYGTTVANAPTVPAPACVPVHGQGQVTDQRFDTSNITAADLAAGVNYKFKTATKVGFEVPKR